MKKNSVKKMQSVSFRNVDEFLEYLPEDELKIVEALRYMIFDCIPEAVEKLSYNVPFYRKNSSICFIWPSSILWGKKQTWQGVRLGFSKGYLMRDEINYLDKGDRKQVYWHDFHSLDDIQVDLLRSYLFEALMVDEVGIKLKE